MIVLDSNVISELMRPAPDLKVERWAFAAPAGVLFTTAITQAELLFGVAQLPAGRRRATLEAAARQIFERDFAGRTLPFDSAAAERFASIRADRRAAGKPIQPFDAQIAAIALSRRAELATRNLADFQGCGLTLIDPWSAGAQS